jgi:hypothetical protein
MIEPHPFGYFLPSKVNKLIIGSFPCFNGRTMGIGFTVEAAKVIFGNYYLKLLIIQLIRKKTKKNYVC